mgnify:CR=1 FL=1
MGFTCNRKPNIPKEKWLRLKALLHNLTTCSEEDRLEQEKKAREYFKVDESGNISGSNELVGVTTASFGSLKIDGASVDFSGLPTSDPGVAGRLYRNGADIKISI